MIKQSCESRSLSSSHLGRLESSDTCRPPGPPHAGALETQLSISIVQIISACRCAEQLSRKITTE